MNLGDVQPNNVLWKLNADDSLSTDVAAFLDFQVTHVGTCIGDMFNNIYMALSVEEIMQEVENVGLFWGLKGFT